MPNEKQLTEEELQNLSQDELLALFVEQLLIDKGEEATDEKRHELLEKIGDRINTGILEKMPEISLDKLNLALDNPNVTDEEIEKIVDDSGVDVAEVTSRELVKFREEYLGKEEK